MQEDIKIILKNPIGLKTFHLTGPNYYISRTFTNVKMYNGCWINYADINREQEDKFLSNSDTKYGTITKKYFDEIIKPNMHIEDVDIFTYKIEKITIRACNHYNDNFNNLV